VATIERFEDIEGWKAARVLTRIVYDVAGEGTFVKDRRLRDQITGAAISVMANIAKGFGSDTNAQFITFLGYARHYLQAGSEDGQCHRRLRPLLAYLSRPASRQIRREMLSRVLDAQHRTPNPES